MSKSIPTPQIKKKRRTREHIIADLSVNYVERFALQCGFSVEKIREDYGYDMAIFTYDSHGEIENGWILIQLKAKYTVRFSKQNPGNTSFPLDQRDLALWLKEIYPVILVLYSAKDDKAYWLYVQAHFESKQFKTVNTKTVSVPINSDDMVNKESIQHWRTYKSDVQSKFINGVIEHHA